MLCKVIVALTIKQPRQSDSDTKVCAGWSIGFDWDNKTQFQRFSRLVTAFAVLARYYLA